MYSLLFFPFFVVYQLKRAAGEKNLCNGKNFEVVDLFFCFMFFVFLNSAVLPSTSAKLGTECEEIGARWSVSVWW